ncbi:MAG: hypothetical protein ABJE66_01565 [Deltaproteobacteria bacterium]
MASSKKKKSSKKPAAKTTTKKKKAAPAKASAKKAKTTPKKKAGKPAPKAAAKKKPAAKKAAPKPAPKPAKSLNTGDAWDNAAMAPKVAAKTPVVRMSEPSMSPPHALHDHVGGLVSPVDDEEEVAERIHGGEEAVKDQNEDGDSGSPRLDDREDEDE